MQYSYERWANDMPESSEAVETATSSAAAAVFASGQEEQPFPVSDDLKALEETLSLDLEEGMEAFHQYRQSQHAQENETVSGESDWDELARLVADHVMAYMLDNPFQGELNQLRGKMDEYYQDNRKMAQHVQQLVDENEQLRVSVSACELELARFRNLAGNLYFKL